MDPKINHKTKNIYLNLNNFNIRVLTNSEIN